MADVAVVVGVAASDGLGAAIARRFAREGLTLLVAGRTPERLEQVCTEINATGGESHWQKTDATVESEVEALMQRAAQLGVVKSVIFNVGNNQPIAFADLTPDTFEQFWRVCVFSGYLTARAALPILEQNSGSLLFTGASASMRGRPGFAHFGSAKAGLRNLAQALAKDYGPKGVHVGHVVVDGGINGERLRSRFSQYMDSLGEDGTLSPNAIADSYWFMHQQPRSVWTFELDVRPYKENW